MTDPRNPGSPWGSPEPPQPPPGPTQGPAGPMPPPAPPGQPIPGWQPPGAPSAGTGGYPPAQAPRSRAQWVRPAILLVIVVVIVGGFFLLRDRFSSDVASLQPGECFDRPAPGTSVVTDVQRQPCNLPHDAEVFANVTHTAASGAAYPPSAEFVDLAGDECLPIIQTYSGLSVPQLIARNLDYGYFYPTSESWGDGDRVITCYATSADDTKLTASIRSAAAPSPSP